MTYSLDIDLTDIIDETIESVMDEVAEALQLIRNRTQGSLTHQEEFDLDEVLARRNEIALIWSIDDVNSIRHDLTDDQAWEVLKIAKENHDANHGISWDTLRCVADDLFPKKRIPRSAEIAKIIAAYDPNGDERENLVGLLTDTMHWCTGFGEPFDEFYRTAKIHFNEESTTNGE